MNADTPNPKRWIGATAIAGTLIALTIVVLREQPIAAAQDRDEANSVHLFFTPESASDAADLVESLLPHDGKIRFFGRRDASQGVILRPIMLVPDYGTLTRLLNSPAFIRLLRALEELAAGSGASQIRLWHPEGVVLARKLGIERVPAIAVEHTGHWHVASGSRVDWNALFDCRGGR